MSTSISISGAMRQEPIPSPSEPMQYRAIGLIRGKYIPSEEQLNSRLLVTDEGQSMPAILLGRVLSLVKNHLELAEEHLWVVYPRTQEIKSKKPRRASDPPPVPELRFQIVGIWEPETLHRLEDEEESEQEEEMETISLVKPMRPASPPSTPEAATVIEDGYFSVRGEAIFYEGEKNRLIVKIQQLNRKNPDQRRDFKLHLFGQINEDRVLHHFWDLQVKREEGRLVIVHAERIGPMPPRRRKPVGNRKPFNRQGPPNGKNRPQHIATGNAAVTTPKPVIAKRQQDLGLESDR
ncbi:MAG: hypothetical protein ACO3NK_12130 [Prochlorotrichaceae cyanobacterium]